MTRRLSGVSVLVREYDEAIAYFTHILGFMLREDTPLGGAKRWVVVAPSADPAGIILARAVGPAQESAVGKQAGDRVWLFLETGDFARDHQAMKDRGVEFLEAPRNEPYGSVAVFRDLYGNKWDLLSKHGGQS